MTSHLLVGAAAFGAGLVIFFSLREIFDVQRCDSDCPQLLVDRPRKHRNNSNTLGTAAFGAGLVNLWSVAYDERRSPRAKTRRHRYHANPCPALQRAIQHPDHLQLPLDQHGLKAHWIRLQHDGAEAHLPEPAVRHLGRQRHRERDHHVATFDPNNEDIKNDRVIVKWCKTPGPTDRVFNPQWFALFAVRKTHLNVKYNI
ncbi:hypothetical protein niasHT_007349 [Heterodera trifolii]|uniref:Uncharacterized protein n=1 Tax=Heterodera trifolii TaxID=157864 RepID=A0ABD2LP04_9BILA